MNYSQLVVAPPQPHNTDLATIFECTGDSSQDQPGRGQDPRRHGGHQEHARRGRRGLLLHGTGGGRGLPALHAPARCRAAARRWVQQRALQVQVDALAGHPFRYEIGYVADLTFYCASVGNILG